MNAAPAGSPLRAGRIGHSGSVDSWFSRGNSVPCRSASTLAMHSTTPLPAPRLPKWLLAATSGIEPAAAPSASPMELVRGGRYDGVGEAFGRARSATGFSLELRELLAIAGGQDQAADAASAARVAAPWQDDSALRAAVMQLRRAGTVVVQLPESELASWAGKKLVSRAGAWQVS